MIVVIPMAGRGSRFSNVGYETPKPLIEIDGKPMIYHAFQSIKNVQFRKLIFVALKEHEKNYQVSQILKKYIPHEFELILLDDVTEGQLCTVLKAAHFFENEEGLLIAASDSFIESNIAEEVRQNSFDGIISVFDMPGEQWSFAKIDQDNKVIEVSEKKRISDYASTGIYYFKDAKKFQFEAEKVIENRETTKNEYYVMPLYSKFIHQGAIIKLSHATSMWDMGTPESKLKFENYLNGK